MILRTLVLLVLVFTTSSSIAQGQAGIDVDEKIDLREFIVDYESSWLVKNGYLSSGYQATGALINIETNEICSATLVSCMGAITAAHCVNSQDKKQMLLYFPNAGLFKIDNIFPHDLAYTHDVDVAFLKLGSAVKGINPAELHIEELQKDDKASVVGFGASDIVHRDHGVKRAGAVKLEYCPKMYGGKSKICWSYIGESTGRANSCKGDSGGSVYIPVGNTERLAAVVRGGKLENCGIGDVSSNIPLSEISDWLSGQIGSEKCTSQNYSSRVLVQKHVFDSRISYDFEIFEDMKEVVVAVNGTSSFGTSGSVQVRPKSNPNKLTKCENPALNFFSCKIKKPGLGIWELSIDTGNSQKEIFQIHVTGI